MYSIQITDALVMVTITYEHEYRPDISLDCFVLVLLEIYFWTRIDCLMTFNTVSYDNEIKNDLLLDDKVTDNKPESNKVLFAKGLMDPVTDIQYGPDGYLYALTYFDVKYIKYPKSTGIEK